MVGIAWSTRWRPPPCYRDGGATGFDRISTYVTAELAYVVEVEHLRSKIGDSDEPADIDLRVTSVFRPEDSTWKLCHRHADPITTPRPPESVLGDWRHLGGLIPRARGLPSWVGRGHEEPSGMRRVIRRFLPFTTWAGAAWWGMRNRDFVLPWLVWGVRSPFKVLCVRPRT